MDRSPLLQRCQVSFVCLDQAAIEECAPGVSRQDLRLDADCHIEPSFCSSFSHGTAKENEPHLNNNTAVDRWAAAEIEGTYIGDDDEMSLLICSIDGEDLFVTVTKVTLRRRFSVVLATGPLHSCGGSASVLKYALWRETTTSARTATAELLTVGV
jgi:hypothetical protein